MKNTVIIILAVVSILFFGVSAMFYLENRTSNTVLQVIAAARHGIDMAAIKEKFGKPANEVTDVEVMVNCGPIDDKKFLINKKLFQYYYTPKCHYIDIYTDLNDVVVYVTWHQP